MNDDLTLIIGDTQLTGWNAVRLTRGIERCPTDFEISFTEKISNDAESFLIEPGDPCKVLIGKDVVMTGFVDRYHGSISAGQHTVTVVGRGKCADLVDCSAEWKGGQIQAINALGIAQVLAQPYGIHVESRGDVEEWPAILQFSLLYGETPYELIERVCRYNALLAYETVEGHLILTRAGQESAASGFEEGVNVLSAAATYSQDQRFSEYRCYVQSMEVFSDLGEGGNLEAIALDAGVTRRRIRCIVSETPSGGHDFAQKRVTWEANRRYGRSNVVRLIVDSWRDSKGALWQPNTLASLHVPSIHCEKKKWLISEVVYRRDEGGTTAEITMMPPAAFGPMPAVQTSVAREIPSGSGVTP